MDRNVNCQKIDQKQFWKTPWEIKAPAFKIANELFYVGNQVVSSYLIKSQKGVVLIDTAFAQTAYLLTESIRSVGVDPSEISMIIHTHGHVDHCGATRRLIELSDAVTFMGEQDIETVEQGTSLTCEEYYYGMMDFETFKVDNPIRHMDRIDLGNMEILCHHTPGHTAGTFTFTFDTEMDGERLTAGLFGGPGLWPLENEHREKQGYLQNREDYLHSLTYLKSLNVDVWLGAHPGQSQTFEKYERLRNRERPNPFIDPSGWKQFINMHELIYRDIFLSKK